jgi:SAM-dependent methyltransferase
MWRAKRQLLAPYDAVDRTAFADYHLCFKDFPGGSSQDDVPQIAPYAGLSAIYDSYANSPDYIPLLDALARNRGNPIRSVLDIGCGTGVLISRLAAQGRRAVGLDASSDMLNKARLRCADLSGVELIEADFRTMRLNRTFDAVVCAFNTLNYVSDEIELHKVFQAVADHLRPGGVFVFDAYTAFGMIGRNKVFSHYGVAETRFVLQCEYDASRRRQKVDVLLPTGVEIHWRIPIDPDDVLRAVEGTGLRVQDYFVHMGWIGFFILIKEM